ncbi:MAG: hypothetical protein ACRDO7_15810, partial [Nocardioidaceae bacterium]
MVTESTKKLRELLAFVLLGVVTVLVLVPLSMLLFKTVEIQGQELSDGAFGLKATMLQGDFVNPAYVLLVVAAVVLVTHLGEPTSLARVVTIGGLSLLGVMGLMGLVTLAAGFGLKDQYEGLVWFGTVEGSGKLAGTITMLALLVLVAGALYFCVATLMALPATAKPQQQQQWGAQPQQQAQWGGAAGAQQGQWGADPQAQQQWGAPQQEQSASWGQPQESAPQQQWGAPQQEQSASWGQPQESAPVQWDTPQQQDQPASWGQPPASPEQPQWGVPQQEQSASWGQPQESAPGQWDTPQQQEQSASSWGQPQESPPGQWDGQGQPE